MNILLGCNHLHELGGSEQHLFTLAKQFTKDGHNVYVILGNFTLKGSMSELLEKQLSIKVDEIPIGVKFDRVFLSHTSTVKRFKEEFFTRKDLTFDKGRMFQICHGVYPELEQPFEWELLKYIAITEEVKFSILKKTGKLSFVIPNPIDTNYFYQTESNLNIRNVYSLSQNDNFNTLLKEICDEKGFSFTKNNKHTNPTLDIRKNIEIADLVFSLGRGCFEAMSMGKNVIIADDRGYMENSYMDGLVTHRNFEDFLKNNCSGRFSKIKPTKQNILQEIGEYSVKNCSDNRKILKFLCDSKKICRMFLLAL